MSGQPRFRDPAQVARLADALRATVTRAWTLMEVCGGQTHAILRYGLPALLPPNLRLIHGPGCPVCVTPVSMIDKALALARRPEIILCSFGDMLRVPGSDGDLLTIKAQGGDVRTVYSPLDAMQLARKNPGRTVVFFSVGFETTTPAAAMAVELARRQGLKNFTILASQVCVPPVLRLMLAAPGRIVQGLLAPGHVCAITGLTDYESLARDYRVPIVITGFEPVDILAGILECVRLLETGSAVVSNAYARAVHPEGNREARIAMIRVFRPVDRVWRGIGLVPDGGLALRDAYQDADAERRFDLPPDAAPVAGPCRAGDVLRGLLRPPDCPAFGKTCTPAHPLGAPMVSTEGACAAYYGFARP